MSIWIVQKQMIMIFAMILIGVYLYKSKHLSDETSKQLSWIIVNVTNPVTLPTGKSWGPVKWDLHSWLLS